MKNRKILTLSFLFFTLIILSACSSDRGQNQAETKSGNTEDFAMRRPDFGQPEEEPDVRGLVSDLVGNEVSVLKIERPQFDGENGQPEGEAGEENEEKNQALTMSGAATGRVPGMGGGRGMRPDRENMDEDAQAQMLEMMKERATGEEKVIIPVGIQMLKPEEGSDMREPSMIEASLDDIKENIMIQVWLDESVTDRNVAKFVLIMN